MWKHVLMVADLTWLDKSKTKQYTSAVMSKNLVIWCNTIQVDFVLTNNGVLRMKIRFPRIHKYLEALSNSHSSVLYQVQVIQNTFSQVQTLNLAPVSKWGRHLTLSFLLRVSKEKDVPSFYSSILEFFLGISFSKYLYPR